MSESLFDILDSSVYFKALFESVTTGILVTDSEGQIIATNHFVLEEFGFTRDELIGKNLKKLLTGDLLKEDNFFQNDRFSKNNNLVLLPKEEIYGIRKDGSSFNIEVSIGSYLSKGEKYFVVFVADVSSPERTEAGTADLSSELKEKLVNGMQGIQETMVELKESQKNLGNLLSFQKALLDTAGAIIIVTDAKGIIRLFNPEAETKLGYKQEEVLGIETPLIFHIEEEIEKKRNDIFKLTGNRITDSFEVMVDKARHGIHSEEQYTFITKSGKTLPVSLTITAMKDDNQQINGFIGISIDLTDRVRAEKELKKQQLLFLQLLYNYPDGAISIVDRNGHFLYTGGELHKQLQSDIGQLIGKEMYPRFPQPLKHIVFEKVMWVFENREKISNFELPVQIMNHTYIMDVFPLIEEDESLNYVGVIIKNITKLKEAEISLREALQKERKLGELKSRFVSMASHEFRTPLSTVLSSAYLIEKYTLEEDQSKRERHLQRIISSVNTLTDILNEFLNIGKIEEGKINPKFSGFNLKEKIHETIDEMKDTLKDGQEIKYHHDGETSVYLDVSLLKHIVRNLVSNASKFSHESSPIEIITTNKNGTITLSVKDRGIGISEEDQEHLMERFFRGANAVSIQGTGLGLHIIAKYAEMMNGEIKCNSKLNEGTAFTVTFHTKSNYYEKNLID